MKKIIDFRSDTVTLPTDEMLNGFSTAHLGDDVFEEDPTVNQLEKLAADLTGKQSALFVPSGTMGNLISGLVHCCRGDEAIIGSQSHMFLYEAGGLSALGGIFPHVLENNPDGTIDINLIKQARRADNVHFPKTRLICLENTHNMCFGTPLSAGYMKEVYEFAEENNLKVHLDGARIFNASVALGIDIKELTCFCHSISLCLSKGLCAPVGSMICSTKEFIYEARRCRKMLGGGMRQAGVIASAGIIAMKDMKNRLVEDHENAKFLAKGLETIDGIGIDAERVSTNILYFNVSANHDPEKFVSELEDNGIRIMHRGENEFRMVTHKDINSNDIEESIKFIKKMMINRRNEKL